MSKRGVRRAGSVWIREVFMVTIEVIGRDGRGLAGAAVQISWNNWTHSTGRTNHSGRVSWDVSGGSGTVYVESREVYEGSIWDTVRVHAG
jgi:hypothetical protein